MIDPGVSHVEANDLNFDYHQQYYVSIKLIDNVGHEVMQTSAQGVETGLEWNAILINDNIETIFDSNQNISISFRNDCTFETWDPENAHLSVKALNLDSEFDIDLDEVIEPGQQKVFYFSVPPEWTSVPRFLKLDIQMTENDVAFGQKVHRKTLVSPYIKIASWKVLSLNGPPYPSYLSEFFKSTRSDTDIGLFAMRCVSGNCYESPLHILPHNKAAFESFKGQYNDQNCKN